MPATSVFLILPLCFTKRIDFLKYASILGVFTIIYVVMLIIIEYAEGSSKPGYVLLPPSPVVQYFYFQADQDEA